jgi:hypothetical protein
MKTIKLVMIATLLTFTAVGIANADGFKSKPITTRVVNISFEKAVQIPGLVAAMNQQLNVQMLESHPGKTWTASVIYKNVDYRITGTREQWELFFNWQRITKNSDGQSN